METKQASKYWPVFAAAASVAIYFLALVLAVNLVAIFGVVQGWSILEIETWFDTSLSAKFAIRLAQALIGIGLVYSLMRLVRLSWTQIGLRTPRFKDILYATAGYAAYLPIYIVTVIIAKSMIPSIDLDQKQQLGFDGPTSGAALLIIFVSLVILPPLYEEILARGFLFTGLRKRLTVPVAAVITSLLFGAAHLGWRSGEPLLWAAAIDTFVLSLVLVYLRVKTDSLWPPIGLHAIKNLVAFLLLFVINKT